MNFSWSAVWKCQLRGAEKISYLDAAARNVFTVVVYIRFGGSPIVKHDTSLENVTVNQENCKLISKLTVAELFSYFIHFLVRLLLWAKILLFFSRPVGLVIHCTGGAQLWVFWGLGGYCYETCYEMKVSWLHLLVSFWVVTTCYLLPTSTCLVYKSRLHYCCCNF